MTDSSEITKAKRAESLGSPALLREVPSKKKDDNLFLHPLFSHFKHQNLDSVLAQHLIAPLPRIPKLSPAALYVPVTQTLPTLKAWLENNL